MKPCHRILTWAVFLAPFLLLGYWLRQYSYEYFLWDDWGLILNRFPGDDLTPSLRCLFAPHAGHRIPLLNLSLIPLITLGNGDPRTMIPISVLLAAVAGLLLIKLARGTVGNFRKTGGLIETAVIALAVASPILGHAWLWWICWPIFVPFACLLGAILLLSGTGQPSGIRFALALVLSILAPLAHASGAIVWLALLPVLWGHIKESEKPRRLVACLIWGIMGLAILWPFIATADESQVKRDLGLFESVWKTASYALVLLGGNLGQGISDNPLTLSRIFGGILALLGGAILLALVWARKDPVLVSRLRPWVSVYLFGFLAAAAIALGRSKLPDEQALGGRYLLLTYSIYLGVFFCLRILTTRHTRGRPNSLGAILAALLLLLQVNAWFEGHRIFKWDFARHEARVACVNFIRVFPDNPALRWCWPELPNLKLAVEKLQAHGKLSGYRLYRTGNLSEIGRPKPLPPTRGGHVTSASTDAEGNARIEGYAWFPTLDKPADLILLSFSREGTDDEDRIFCLVPMEIRDDLYRSHERGRRPEKFASWKIRLAPGQFPPGEIVVRAWAFDHANKRYHTLRNTISLSDGLVTGFDREVTGHEETRLESIWPEKP